MHCTLAARPQLCEAGEAALVVHAANWLAQTVPGSALRVDELQRWFHPRTPDLRHADSECSNLPFGRPLPRLCHPVRRLRSGPMNARKEEGEHTRSSSPGFHSLRLTYFSSMLALVLLPSVITATVRTWRNCEDQVDRRIQGYSGGHRALLFAVPWIASARLLRTASQVSNHCQFQKR